MSAAPQLDMRVYARYAPLWRAAGWDGVLPLPARQKQEPPRGFTGDVDRWPTEEDVAGWCGSDPNGNLGLRFPKGVLGVDADCYKPDGLRTWQLLEEECGPFPDTWVITSRDDGMSGIRLVRAPDIEWRGGMPGLETLHYKHRYAVLPGSWHPDGRQYRLLYPDDWGYWSDATIIPSPTDLPHLPDTWVERLRKDSTTEVRSPELRKHIAKPTDDWAPSVHKAYGSAVALMTSGNSRHDSTLASVMALARLEKEEWPGATDAINLLERTFIKEANDRKPDVAAGEWNRMLGGAREKVARTPSTIPRYENHAKVAPLYVVPRTNDVPAGVDPETGEVVPTGTTKEPTGSIHLPDSFYAARPELTHISNAARARMIGRDALLGICFSRVAALSNYTLRIPAIVGKPVGLTFHAAVVGPPGASKSSCAGTAQELLPGRLNPRMVDMVPVGSGEGLIELLFEWVEEEVDGKTVKEKRQTRNAANIYIDEGAVLGEIGGRRGSTLLPTIRSMWTSDVLGQANASAERKRILSGDSYVFGLALGVQPELAGPLLNDTAAGTPQRFVWFSALDPDIPDTLPDWPDELGWDISHTYGRNLSLDDGIVTEVRAERLAVMRGAERDPGDSHATLARLKVAALLALLGRRTHIASTDWELSAVVMATSNAVRKDITQALQLAAKATEDAATAKHVRRELTVDSSREAQALRSSARSVGRLVRRHQHDDGGCRRSCLTAAIAGKHRKLVTVDEVIAEAERREWITPAGEHWAPGRDVPA